MMDFFLNIDLKKLPVPISYGDKILLIGSCFTEHIGNALAELKFPVMQNPNGILFGPDSVCRSLQDYIENKPETESSLFQWNEVWHHWQYHSRFSGTSRQQTLDEINTSRQKAHEFLKEAQWLVITLGSSFSYQLTSAALPGGETTGAGVANCHRAPAAWFEKVLLGTDQISVMLDRCIQQLRDFNPGLQVIFTVSPVRHIRDGVIENNRSKARLIECVHRAVGQYSGIYYFPAYELVIDVLRDYRFYDIDLVHPNYSATAFVLERFSSACIHEEARELMEEIRKIVIARKHRAFQPDTEAHRQFLRNYFEKASSMQRQYPFLDLSEEIRYFSQT